MTASSFIRSAEAASIQWPFQPDARSFGCIALVQSPPWHVIDDVEPGERRRVVRVAQRLELAADVRAGAAGARGREEHRIDVIEVALREHALQEHRPDHAAPTDDSDSHGSHLTPLRLPRASPPLAGTKAVASPTRQVVVVVTFFVMRAPTAAAGAGRAERIGRARECMAGS
jgi:hypothetical protein